MKLLYFNPFWKAKARNEVEYADIADFEHKLITMSTSLEQSEKGPFNNQQPNIYHVLET